MASLLVCIGAIIIVAFTTIIIYKSETEREKLEGTIRALGCTPIWEINETSEDNDEED